MMAFLWDQEIDGANPRSGYRGQEVLVWREELLEGADVQGSTRIGESE